MKLCSANIESKSREIKAGLMKGQSPWFSGESVRAARLFIFFVIKERKSARGAFFHLLNNSFIRGSVWINPLPDSRIEYLRQLPEAECGMLA
jgi:hypothetical protein